MYDGKGDIHASGVVCTQTVKCVCLKRGKWCLRQNLEALVYGSVWSHQRTMKWGHTPCLQGRGYVAPGKHKVTEAATGPTLDLDTPLRGIVSKGVVSKREPARSRNDNVQTVIPSFSRTIFAYAPIFYVFAIGLCCM